MDAPMRKQQRLIADTAEVEAILYEARFLHLAMSADDQPYVLPLSFGYAPGVIYLHSGTGGLKLETLAHNPKVSFSVMGKVEMIPGESPCQWSTHYESVVGFGAAVVVGDPEERRHGLEVIADHYVGPGPHEFIEKSMARTEVIRIDIESMTGRRHAG